jgi:hypothetical protein
MVELGWLGVFKSRLVYVYGSGSGSGSGGYWMWLRARKEGAKV